MELSSGGFESDSGTYFTAESSVNGEESDESSFAADLKKWIKNALDCYDCLPAPARVILEPQSRPVLPDASSASGHGAKDVETWIDSTFEHFREAPRLYNGLEEESVREKEQASFSFELSQSVPSGGSSDTDIFFDSAFCSMESRLSPVSNSSVASHEPPQETEESTPSPICSSLLSRSFQAEFETTGLTHSIPDSDELEVREINICQAFVHSTQEHPLQLHQNMVSLVSEDEKEETGVHENIQRQINSAMDQLGANLNGLLDQLHIPPTVSGTVNQGDVPAVHGIGNLSDSQFNRRIEQHIDRAMDLFGGQIDQCLDQVETEVLHTCKDQPNEKLGASEQSGDQLLKRQMMESSAGPSVQSQESPVVIRHINKPNVIEECTENIYRAKGELEIFSSPHSLTASDSIETILESYSEEIRLITHDNSRNKRCRKLRKCFANLSCFKS